MSPNCSGDSSKLTIYNPNITNNIANFIYSQIIYPNIPNTMASSRFMLKPYLQAMSNINEGFINMEGFSLYEGMDNSIVNEYGQLRDPKYNLPSVEKMYNAANDLNNDNAFYEKRLGQISYNSNDLQSNLVNYDKKYRELVNAKDDFYDMSGNHLLYYQNKDIPSLRDTKISDNQQFIIQQNTIYIIGTITCASMILAAIILARQ
jgi:hypothetical protein